jgi:hypothetical protein
VTDDSLPLLHARRPVGRPRKFGHVSGTSSVGDCDRSGPKGRPLASEAGALLSPRLLDVHGLAAYLSVPEATVYDLSARGVLRRVRVPLPDGSELRKLLFDRDDVDRLIDAWKD